ncbi:putative protein 8 [Haloarcula hispanica icosahedral virus 2]|uniref:Uncharacterized protein n=1 Tax=Haloarcula hispanica icosahedral virus 2 TaxID=1154689 RepID=H9AZW4_9VIRU|nr:putative protein 8 [Haloarcula hispanica icosahedral virus 2]AFD02289.1 putative protein 8 [Haloarcula hispanica icosahedral virus 2]
MIDVDLSRSAEDSMAEASADLGRVGWVRSKAAAALLLAGLLVMPQALREQSVDLAESAEAEDESERPKWHE